MEGRKCASGSGAYLPLQVRDTAADSTDVQMWNASRLSAAGNPYRPSAGMGQRKARASNAESGGHMQVSVKGPKSEAARGRSNFLSPCDLLPVPPLTEPNGKPEGKKDSTDMTHLGQFSQSQNRIEWDKDKNHTDRLGPMFLEEGPRGKVQEKKTKQGGHAVWQTVLSGLRELSIRALGQWQPRGGGHRSSAFPSAVTAAQADE